MIAKTNNTPVANATPTHTAPIVSFDEAINTATAKLDALLKGGADCVTYIASAMLCGYLANTGAKVKISVMRDQFKVALGKKGLGGTQTNKYLDYGQKLAQLMFKECEYGKEIADLLKAKTAEKAHDAVGAWLKRSTHNKKTEHGFVLTAAVDKLNVLGVFLGFETDPATPDTLGDTPETAKAKAEKEAKAKTATAKKINDDPTILKQVSTDAVLKATAEVISFPVLIRKHVEMITSVSDVEAELAEITKAYRERIAALSKNLGKRPARKAKGNGRQATAA